MTTAPSLDCAGPPLRPGAVGRVRRGGRPAAGGEGERRGSGALLGLHRSGAQQEGEEPRTVEN